MSTKTLRKSVSVAPISEFHRSLFDAATAGKKASETMKTKSDRLIKAWYGDVSPTYEQWTADRAALSAIAAEKGLVDAQWAKRVYNAAIKAAFKVLPVSMSEAAVLKRASAGRSDKAPKAETSGPVKGETQERKPSPAETLEQMVARVGIPATLTAVANILAAATATAACAKRARSLQAEVIVALKPAEVAKAAKVAEAAEPLAQAA
jgi:hypothetical protein